MIAHKERDHALLSASGAQRWLTCTPSARLEEQFPDTTSEAAKEGTLAHELAEKKLINYFNCVEISKRQLTYAIKKMRAHELWSDEMLTHTDTYVDYIKGLAIKMPSAPYVTVEKRLDLGLYAPESFGTVDCVLIQGDTLYVIDFKYGKGVPVSAEENPQLMLYALGAYESCKTLYPIQRIHLAIVQPRLPDGITEWTCTLEDLLVFGDYVQERSALAFKGEGDYVPSEKACRFCRARAQCRARADHNTALAFAVGEMPPLITPEEAGNRLLALEDVAKYQKDLKDWALKESLAGNAVAGWKAVNGRSVRDWTDMDTAFDRLVKSGVVAGEMLWEKKPLSLAQVEKIVGKKDFDGAVGKFIISKPGAPTLVKETDKREPITNKVSASDAFKTEEN